MDLPAFYARRVSEYIGGLVAAKETYKFQDADSLSHAHSHLLAYMEMIPSTRINRKHFLNGT